MNNMILIPVKNLNLHFPVIPVGNLNLHSNGGKLQEVNSDNEVEAFLEGD